MGKVYLARDPKLNREVAIKVLSRATDSQSVRRRFRYEARAVAALRHPNIVELYDYSGENAADLFLVMEYLPGRNLQELIQERGPMSEPTVLCVGHELALALEHAHQHSVVHRDIKPDNVVLYQGRVVLMDFGVVKAVARHSALGELSIHNKTQVVGTPGFMAPEQIEGRKIDHRTDLFALGSLLYFLATGHGPFDGDNLNDVFNRTKKVDYDDPRQYSPLLSEGFCNLLSQCLQLKMARRVPSAEKLRLNLLAVLRAHGVSEVRHELRSYNRNPAQHAVEQRERGLDVLVRDLKLAVKDKDERRVQAIVHRMQTVSPLGNQMRDVTGIMWDPQNVPRLTQRSLGIRRGRWFAAGLVLGLLVGAVVTAITLTGHWKPTQWVSERPESERVLESAQN